MKERPCLFYLLHYFENRGGTENHVRDLIRGLRGQYCIYTLYREGNQLVIRDENDQIRRFETEPIPWLFVPHKAKRTEALLHQLIQEHKPQIIHIHHLLNWPLSIIDLIKEYPLKIFLTLHDYFLITPDFTLMSADEPNHCFSNNYAQKLGLKDNSYLVSRHQIIAELLKKIDHIICPSQACQDIYKKIFQINYQVIEHGVQEFTPLQKKQSDKFRLGYIGSLLPQKGWQILFAAFNQLAPANCELHFYGGTDQNSNNIFFHGVYELNDLPQICREVDLAIIPSIFPETFCYTLSELWMGQVPVMTSSIGALAQRISHNLNGYKFKANDVNDLVIALKDVLNNQLYQEWQITKPKTLALMYRDYLELYSS